MKSIMLTSDLIMTKNDKYDLVLSGDGNYTLYLPPCVNNYQLEVMMVSTNNVTIDTNSDCSFLRYDDPKKLTIKGCEEAVGKSLTIKSFYDCWRISSSTFDEHLLTFEE